MITNFLIGAIIVAAGWAIFAFGRNWLDTMNRRAKKGGCQYPLRVKIVASTWIVLAYVIGLSLFVLMYAAGAWADRCDRRRFAAALSSTVRGEEA